MHSRTVSIIGQGYVGLPLAIELSKAGWTVYGLDTDLSKVALLKEGQSHIEDVPDSEIRSAIQNERYVPSSDFSLVTKAEFVVLCVPTPVYPDGTPDLRFLEAAVKQIAPFLNTGTLLINESTSFPGTVREYIPQILDSVRGGVSKEILLAAAPERTDPGNEKYSIRNTPRLIGGLTNVATERAIRFYETICSNVIEVSSPEVAELAKLLENTFRQVNIALMNQLVPLCRSLGVDTREVAEAASSKPYGFMKFLPGAGVGGHCIPVDPLYLLWKARQIGLDLPFIESADRTNREMPEYVSNRLIESAELRSGDGVLILGVAYKPGVADVRESPAHEVGKFLAQQGLRVFWWDPLVADFSVGNKWDQNESVKGAIVVTAQSGLQVLELVKRGTKVLDCTGAYKGIQGVSQL